jgi:hypothetical protein
MTCLSAAPGRLRRDSTAHGQLPPASPPTPARLTHLRRLLVWNPCGIVRRRSKAGAVARAPRPRNARGGILEPCGTVDAAGAATAVERRRAGLRQPRPPVLDGERSTPGASGTLAGLVQPWSFWLPGAHRKRPWGW